MPPQQYWSRQSLRALSKLARKVATIEHTLRGRLLASVVPCEFKKFQLKGSLTAGGSAVAYYRYEDPSGGGSGVPGLVVDTDVTFTVYDDTGDLTGLGADDAGSGEAGAFGKAQKWPGETRWYIYDLECDTR